VKVAVAIALVISLCALVSCGGSSSPAPQNTGLMTGNWQLNLTEGFPPPATQISVGGFLVQSNNSVTGSVQGPTIVGGSGTAPCGGISPFVGTISGQNISFSLNPGGTEFDFTGTVSSNGQTMSGSYQALGGACLGVPTSGTWMGTQVPPLNGSFTGTLVSTEYMPAYTGLLGSSGIPISVSGSFTQSPNNGASNASLTGTITAVGYPCFKTAYLSGTINGQNVYLDVYDYSGVQIGTLGVPGSGGIAGSATPATVVLGPTGVSLQGSAIANSGLSVGNGTAPSCPPIYKPDGTGTIVSGDTADVNFNFSF